MSNKHEIKKSLKNLIKDDREFVAILSGEWGIGKTYFWHEFTKSYLKDKDVVYISLFGQNSLADIEEDIIAKLFRYKDFTKKYKNHLNTIGGWLSKHIGLPFNVSIGNILSLFNPSDFKNIIICFDDFERLSNKVPLKDVMGLISQFKEQKECKIVMILNEGEFSEENHKVFSTYKEKIVDFNLHYIPIHEELFEAIKEDVKKITFCEPQTIDDFFKKIKLKNIRIMKQALYQLNHFNFIKDYKFDDKVINEFVEIALNLFVFKAKSNYIYSEFEDLKKYVPPDLARKAAKRIGSSIDENIEETRNDKHEKCLKYYNENHYSHKEYRSNNRDIIEQIIYTFIDTHILEKEKIQKELKENNEYLERYDIRDRISNLHTRLYTDFSVSNKEIAKQLYKLLNTHKDIIHRLFQYDRYKPIIADINHFAKEILTTEFKEEIAKNYIAFYIDNPDYNLSGPVDIEGGQSSLLISDYDWAKTYINDYRDKQKIASKEALPIIEAILDRRFLLDEGIFKLNQLNMKDYKKQIKENPDFIQPLIKFLDMNDFKVVNISDSKKKVREKIINALQSLHKESDDYAWKVDKILESARIEIEEKK